MAENVFIVIPARSGSTRYPNKPMASIAGKTMLQRVWEIAQAVPLDKQVVIATDDEAIKEHATSFGAKAMITPACKTGSDRVAFVASQIAADHDIIFSFQGDAVLTPPGVIQTVIDAMINDNHIGIATPAVKLTGAKLIEYIAAKRTGYSGGTNVVFDKDFNALYFSKSLIPHTRNRADTEQVLYRHIGLYGYRYNTLQTFTQLPSHQFEDAECLEQLRALENGLNIKIVLVDYQGRTPASVDYPEDVKVVEDIIAREGELYP